MKKFILLIASIINTVISGVYIAMSPNETIPIHFNINGEADAFSSKWFMLIFPVVLVVATIVDMFFAKHLEKKAKEDSNGKYQNRVTTALFVFVIAIFWVITVVCLNGTMVLGQDFYGLLGILIGVIMIYVSNLMGKLKRNSVIGVRTTATKKSETVWRKTNRLGGALGVISGVVFIICGILGLVFPSSSTILLLVGIGICIVLGAIIPTVYAQVLYSKEKK